MSFLTDLFEGNFGNLGHDLTAHFGQDLPYYLGAAGLGLGGAGLLGAGPLAGLFGGAGEGAAAGLGGEALGFAGEPATGASGGLSEWLASLGTSGAEGGTGLGGNISSAFASAPEALNPATGAPFEAGFDTATGLPSFQGGLDAATGGTDVLAGAADKAASTSTGFLDKLITGAETSLTRNPLGIAAAGAGLGLNMLRGNPNDPNRDLLKQKADQLGTQGQVLMNYLNTGTLPPAMQTQLDQAKAAARARIIQNHAKNGMSTDPSMNSALAAELNAVDINAVAAMADAQIKMMQQGLSETGLSTQLYQTLIGLDRQSNTDLMNAIASFAAALGGGGGWFSSNRRAA